jgi:PAS domain S-box-containing protein
MIDACINSPHSLNNALRISSTTTTTTTTHSTMTASTLMTMVQSFFGSRDDLSASASPDDNDNDAPPPVRQFEATKRLCEKDYVVIDMLNSAGHEQIAFCVCDPDLPDLPICFASDGFCTFTGYAHDEIEGKNCRFLQGTETNKEDVNRIRTAIKERTQCSVNLLNYRKDGTSFCNEFFLSPLCDDSGKLLYYIGVQCPVAKLGPGQMPKNAGYVTRMYIYDTL